MIKISSPYEIFFDNFSYQINITVHDITIYDALYSICFITNGSWIGVMATGIKGMIEGKLEYFHFEIGPFNYAYDNRYIQNQKNYSYLEEG